jgi:hypothetical protein
MQRLVLHHCPIPTGGPAVELRGKFPPRSLETTRSHARTQQPRLHTHQAPPQASARTNDQTRTPAVAATLAAPPQLHAKRARPTVTKPIIDKASEHKTRKNQHTQEWTPGCLTPNYIDTHEARRAATIRADIDALLTPPPDLAGQARLPR